MLRCVDIARVSWEHAECIFKDTERNIYRPNVMILPVSCSMKFMMMMKFCYAEFRDQTKPNEFKEYVSGSAKTSAVS